MKKNYREIFEKENQSTFAHRNQIEKEGERRKKKTVIWVIVIMLFASFFLTYPSSDWNFLSVYTKSNNLINILVNDSVGGILLIVLSIIICIVGIVSNKLPQKLIDADKKTLKEKAKEFATTTYLNDIFSALSTTFTLDDVFKKKLLDIFNQLDWFNDNKFTCHTGDFYWEERYADMLENQDKNVIWIQEKLTLIHERKEYSLKKCYYEDGKFHFLFDTLDTNGRFEKNVEFHLSNK